MIECIIFYDGHSRCNDPVFATKRTLKAILLAKEEHEKRNDRHIFQFKLVPKENVFGHSYAIKPCCSKHSECIRQKQADSIDKSI